MTSTFFSLLRYRAATLAYGLLVFAGSGTTSIAQSVAIGEPNQEAATQPSLTALQQPIHVLLQQSIDQLIKQFDNAKDLRTEIHIGQLNPALKLPPCQQIEPFLPSRAQAWGKVQLGLRCRDHQTRWQVYVPVEVKFFGSVLLTRRMLNIGEAVGVEDVHSEQLELSIYPLASARQMLHNSAQLTDQVLIRTLAAEQPLRSEFFRTRPIIAVGDGVRVLMQGLGFAISAQGKALQSAAEGQPIRVQIENGRILTGTARSNRQVEIAL